MTYLNSGNVVFRGQRADKPSLESAIELGITKTFGFETIALIRRPDELGALVGGNPYATKDLGYSHVTFLKEKPKLFPAGEVRAVCAPGEGFSFTGGEIYLYCPNGYGRTKLNNNFFERKLKVDATTRNWRTVTSLLSLATGGSLGQR